MWQLELQGKSGTPKTQKNETYMASETIDKSSSHLYYFNTFKLCGEGLYRERSI